MLFIICLCHFSNHSFFIHKVEVAFVVVVNSKEILDMKLIQRIVTSKWSGKSHRVFFWFKEEFILNFFFFFLSLLSRKSLFYKIKKKTVNNSAKQTVK